MNTPHLDQREKIDDEYEWEKNGENSEDFIVVEIQRQRALHHVSMRCPLPLRYKRALTFEREQRRLVPRARCPQHFSHPKSVSPNREIDVLTAEGVEEEEA